MNLTPRFKPEAISRVRKALKDAAAGNAECNMTDLDSACIMLDLLLEIYEKKPAMSTQVGGGHYKDLAIQPAEYSQRNRLPYCESAVVKYVTRHRAKNGRQDIEKAIHCLQLLLEIEYPN